VAPGKKPAAVMRQSNARVALGNVLPVILTFIRIIPSAIMHSAQLRGVFVAP